MSGDLEIHVGLPSRHQTKEQKTQLELENALKRRMNRDIKERQLLMHKVGLLCLIARSLKYNRLLSDTSLMQASLKLLPSKNAYPTERGVELKYLQSFITWFKVAVKLQYIFSREDSSVFLLKPFIDLLYFSLIAYKT